MENEHAAADQQRVDSLAAADGVGHAGPMAATSWASDRWVMVSVDASDGVDQQSEESFPASDSPSWGRLSLSRVGFSHAWSEASPACSSKSATHED